MAHVRASFTLTRFRMSAVKGLQASAFFVLVGGTHQENLKGLVARGNSSLGVGPSFMMVSPSVITSYPASLMILSLPCPVSWLTLPLVVLLQVLLFNLLVQKAWKLLSLLSLFFNAVLAFVKAYRLKGDACSLKTAVLDKFDSFLVESAKKDLFSVCKDCLQASGLVCKQRRLSEKRDQLTWRIYSVLLMHLIVVTISLMFFLCPIFCCP